MAVLEKWALNLEDIASQTALKLPERETLDSIICVGGCQGSLTINANVCVNAQVVAALSVLSNALTRATGSTTTLQCQAG